MGSKFGLRCIYDTEDVAVDPTTPFQALPALSETRRSSTGRAGPFNVHAPAAKRGRG